MAEQVDTAFIKHMDWCGIPQRPFKSVDQFVNAMLEELGPLGWRRVPFEDLRGNVMDRLVYLFAGPPPNRDIEAAMKTGRESLLFFAETRAQNPRKGEAHFYFIHESLDAVSSVAVYDNDWKKLGIRTVCLSTVSDAGASAYLGHHLNENLSWDDIEPQLLPEGTYTAVPLDISEFFVEEHNVRARLEIHPVWVDYWKTLHDTFPYAALITTSAQQLPAGLQ